MYENEDIILGKLKSTETSLADIANYNYDWFNINATKRGDYMLARLYNTSKAYKMLTTNEFNLFQSGDTYGHDATLCLHYNSTKLLCVYVANTTDTGDSAYSPNAFVRLQVIQATTAGGITSLLSTLTVAKKDDIIDGKTITSGAGVPNAYIVDDTLHILWSSQCDDGLWYEFHNTYDCVNNILGTPHICQMDSGLMSCQKIATHLGLTVNGQISINARIATLNNYYYACVCSDDKFTNGAIIKSIDFVTWEFVSKPIFNGFNSHAKYEGALCAFNDYLYLALRQSDVDTTKDINPTILAKLDSNGVVVDYVLIPSISSRPSFFLRGTTELFLTIPVDNRLNTMLVRVGGLSNLNLRDSIPLQDIPTGGNYVQVCPRTSNLQFVVRTQGSTGIRVSSMNGLQLDNIGVMTAFNTVMGI